VLFALVLALPVANASAEQAKPLYRYHQWNTAADFALGTVDGNTAQITPDGSLTLGSAPVAGDSHAAWYNGHAYETGSWTSDWFEPGFAFGELVSSWTADTPSGTWIRVDLQITRSFEKLDTRWYVMGIWASGDDTILRRSVRGQGSPPAWIATDTLFTKRFAIAYRLKVRLFRLPGSSATPVVRSVGAITSYASQTRARTFPSPLGGAEGIELNVPRHSQMIHEGHYPQWDGGGEAWCSPTSTEMILEYWGRGPTAEQVAWVEPQVDPTVDYAARFTYDYTYEGAGNWPFNIAYASTFPGMTGFVTQLRSLNEAEQFIKAGIPLVISVAFRKGQLSHWPLGGTNGHLMTIVGFTPEGDVIANDPAWPSNDEVRHVYSREEVERVWSRSTGGITYVIHPEDVPLPPNVPGELPNW
jgi:hypothetical protein